jgi:eukaryotic-like serine/threonine-protein kinase
MTESTFQTLGRYRIHAELGKGGFATVYRATGTALERDVALKVLKPGWTDDAKAVERFMREAKQASRSKLGGVVTIFKVSAGLKGVSHRAGSNDRRPRWIEWS